MLRFISGIFLRLRMFFPIQNGQNTCENFQTENFFKNAQNVEIYQGNKSEVAKFFHLYKMAKTLVKILKLKIFSKMLRMSRFIRGINLSLRQFSPIQKWAKHLKFLRLKFFSKMLRMSRFIRGMNLRLRCFSPIQNG